MLNKMILQALSDVCLFVCLFVVVFVVVFIENILIILFKVTAI